MPPLSPPFFLQNPVARGFKITSRFNDPRNYTFAPTKLQKHEGIDLVAIDTQGHPVAVLAAQRGIVERVGFSPQGYGNYVRIVHEWQGETWATWYGHLSSVTASVGQFVLAGQKIGIAGTTGFSSGIHLHLTLQRIGNGLKNYTVDDVVDPEPYFRLDISPQYDEATFVADVTIPDRTIMQAGQSFEKIWRIRNTGTSTWGAGYALVFAKDDKMGGPDQVPLPGGAVQPGQVVDIGVKLTAPSGTGRHRSTWTLRNATGSTFDHTLYTDIEIKTVKAFDEASYLADVTVEDGTVLQPGEQFVKTWRIKNTGTTTWDERYALRFAGDDRMDGPDKVALTQKVKPGETIEISVPLTAPTKPGRHRSTWKLINAKGDLFEYDQYAEIQIPQQADASEGLSESRWVADVTIPDETQMQPGETFLKTWRIRNTGTTTWGAGHTLVFFADDNMDGPDSVPLPPLKPGQTGQVSVTLTAPTAPGMHKSTWKPRDSQGKIFEFDLFALIDVIDLKKTAQELNELSWVADMTVEDGTAMQPGEAFVKTWRARNTGTTTWGAGYTLAFFGDDKMDGPDSVPLPSAQPGETITVSLMLTAPHTPGLHKSTWKPRDAQNHAFEYDLFALIDVIDPSQTYDLLPFLRGDGRVYDLHFTWGGGGRQRVQTQVEGNKFYHVKYNEWEELWADDTFIYRGTDTSPGGGEVYTLTEQGQYGSAWLPRHMTVGVPFRRMPIVVFRRKSDGVETKNFPHVTWIQLEAAHKKYILPSGIELADVIVLAAFEDANGTPKPQPFERYYYAKKYGLVAWEGSLGKSYLAEQFTPGAMPNNVREAIPWLR